MSFTVSKLENGRVKLSSNWAFEQSDSDALDLFAELSVQRGEQLERERIIKLLEGDAGQQIMCLDCSQELIALIKGEK